MFIKFGPREWCDTNNIERVEDLPASGSKGKRRVVVHLKNHGGRMVAQGYYRDRIVARLKDAGVPVVVVE